MKLKKLNKVGMIKIALFPLFILQTLFISSNLTFSFSYAESIIGIIFFSISIPLIIKILTSILNNDFQKPNWNDNPFVKNNPLIFVQFAAFYLLFSGLTLITLNLTGLHKNNLDVITLPIGIGAYVGLKLTTIFILRTK